MASDPVDAFARKLASLSTTQQSIETLSHWCVFHRRRARELARAWRDELERAPRERKLAFLYLASDVAQTSRKRGAEWTDAFKTILPGAVRHVLESGESGSREKILRLTRVWGERRVFGGAEPESWVKDVVDGKDGGKEDGGAVKAASAVPAAKRARGELAEAPAPSGENASLTKVLVKMEKAEREFARACEVYDADARDDLLDESAIDASEDPTATLRAIQRYESAVVDKRDAGEALGEILDDVEKKLRAALSRVETARANVDVGNLTQDLVRALKVRKKASKAAAAHVASQIEAGGDAALPEPVDFDRDDANDDDDYDPSDVPDEYASGGDGAKRRRA
ncbi:ENTH/VHS [Ostreococcus tauri]|uniref:ENTH/VHS n=1 Tax=Ostreococcus tauri TaxID=70448 RepID=A0A090M3E6_OSTTA|nr:ENTH/VHS [Ostreococcus tauri]CEF98755.1 ENTH/VHS [Ostreococcus tauri]|eukprot:XP_003080377.2 ENTH/VHS [Ostreococcus tauri]